MFVVIKRSKTTKRELVYIVESYRDEKQKIRQRIIKKCGELSELLAKDPDAIEKLREEARRMTEEAFSKKGELTISFNMPNSKTSPMVNYGIFFVEALYNSLKIEPFLERRIGDSETSKRISAALKYFTIREFFSPLPSKKDRSFPEPMFEHSEYDSAPKLNTIGLLGDVANDLQRHIYRIANKGYETDDKVVSLDITSYYFNSKYTSKRPASGSDGKGLEDMILVQVGILFDRLRNPAACVIFSEGNANTETLISEITRIKKKYGLSKVVITSDRGFGSNSTLAALHQSGNGYVVGRKLRNTPLQIQRTILDETGYKWNKAGTFKFKAFPTERTVGDVVIPEKVISMWTSHNAARMRQLRDTSIIDFLANPENYEIGTLPEVDRYVHIHDTNGASGERMEQSFFSFDAESYMRDVALEGYYALVTTEMDIPESVIIKRYHNLQKLGKTYSAPDPDVEGMPEELWSYVDVQSYFLVSFISMVMERKLERMLEFRYSIDEIKDALGLAMCKNIGQDIYNFTVQPEIFKEIESAFGVEFDHAYATLEMIRRYRREIYSGI